MKTLLIGYSRLQVTDADEKYLLGESPLEIVITRERTESTVYTETYKIDAKNLVEAMHKINTGEIDYSERETDSDEDYSNYSLDLVTELPTEDASEDNSPLPGQIDLFGNIVE